MATGTSFKQVCPSCEAMVPIRDPGLIGRKIDCPKCKYRFVVEEPADDEEEDDTPPPKKKGDAKVTSKPAAKGGAKGPSKTNPKKQKDDDDSPKKKKKAAGTSPVLLFGGLLALAAVVGIGVTLYFMLSGDKPPATSTSTPPGTMPATGSGEQAPPAPGGDPVPAPPVLTNVTNLLPNDAQVVVSYPLDRTLGSTLKVEGIDIEGGFNTERFKANMTFGPDEVHRVVSTMNLKDDWVFSVLQTKKPYKADAMKTSLRLAPKESVKSKSGKSYDFFPITGDLDSLSNVLLKLNKPREQFQVHFLDANTMVFADPSAMKKFLEADAKPEFLSKEPISETAAPASGAPGVPGGASNLPGGSPMSPMAPGGAPMSPMSPMAPGGAPMSPMSPMAPGSPGGTPSTPAPVEATPSNYMTLDPALKHLLDRLEVEKPNEKTKQKEIASVVTVVVLVTPLSKPILSQGLTNLQVPVVQRLVLTAAINTSKAIGCGLTSFTSTEAALSIATEVQSRREAESQEKVVRTLLPLALPTIKGALDLTITTPAPATNSSIPGSIPGGIPGSLPGGPMGPLPTGPMSPPGGIPTGPMSPPGGIPTGPMSPPGGIPGTNPGNPGGAEDKGDGTLTLTLFDRTLVATLDMQLTPGASEKLAVPARATMQWLKSQGDLASTRTRYVDLARGLIAYLNDKGEFPRGTALRGDNPVSGSSYRPDQRLSFYAALLPYLGEEYADWKTDASRSWDEDTNLRIGSRILPPVLAHRLPGLSPPVINYPGSDATFGATHAVGIAGIGMDAAEYRAGDPATDKKLGIFGYDRVTKKAEIKDGLDKTIALILVPADHKAPWLAGGGATVRAVADESEDTNPLAPFVCLTYPAKPGEASKWVGKRGTLALMADGKIRFVPADLPAATFRALCTIAGGEEIKGLDTLCPILDVEVDRELKTDSKPIAAPAEPVKPVQPVIPGADQAKPTPPEAKDPK